MDPSANATTFTTPVTLPRIAITFCTQCKWLLRAAWLQQELLSTFGTSVGEIALIPATGGIFQIHMTYKPAEEEHTNEGATEALIWDRKAEGGFPEAKILKQRVRDCIEPGRGLGHSDTPSKKGSSGEGASAEKKEAVDLAGPVREHGPRNPLAQRIRPGVAKGEGGGQDCEDCK